MYVGSVNTTGSTFELQRIALARRLALEVQEKGIRLIGPDLIAYNACISGFQTPGDIQRLTALLEKNNK